MADIALAKTYETYQEFLDSVPEIRKETGKRDVWFSIQTGFSPADNKNHLFAGGSVKVDDVPNFYLAKLSACEDVDLKDVVEFEAGSKIDFPRCVECIRSFRSGWPDNLKDKVSSNQ